MTERRLLVSGDVISSRYHLQDLVNERLGATTWRAHDSLLSRNVGLELIPSDDPRADRFVDAARDSTAVTDPRFLRVVDLVEDHGHHVVVREWARAFGLDAVLAQSPLPSHRAAAVVAEVAEALAHAHELGQYHRRLTPHQILLKESGAVRVTGLGVATALAPTTTPDGEAERKYLERLDVQSLGKILYACLVSRWPGGHVDGLRAAPTEHGKILRPRQVRAGIEREVDTVCDRILGTPPLHHRPALMTAAEVARELRHIASESELTEVVPALSHLSSIDLSRHDPVVEPEGPPPGLEPPRRRPKAFEPPPPTTMERNRDRMRSLSKGERGLVLLGVVGILVIILIIGVLVGRETVGGEPDHSPSATPTGEIGALEFAEVSDLDPQGTDGSENPQRVPLATDGDPETGWRTASYFTRADLGGLKDGVGLLIDVGGLREIDSIRLALAGEATSLSIYVSAPSFDGVPAGVEGLTEVGHIDQASTDVTFSLPQGTYSRYVVVWLRELPEIAHDEYRGEIREIAVYGR